MRIYAIPGLRSRSHTRSGGRPGPRQSTSGSAATLPCPSAGAASGRPPGQSRSASACSKDSLQPRCFTATISTVQILSYLEALELQRLRNLRCISRPSRGFYNLLLRQAFCPKFLTSAGAGASKGAQCTEVPSVHNTPAAVTVAPSDTGLGCKGSLQRWQMHWLGSRTWSLCSAHGCWVHGWISWIS